MRELETEPTVRRRSFSLLFAMVHLWAGHVTFHQSGHRRIISVSFLDSAIIPLQIYDLEYV